MGRDESGGWGTREPGFPWGGVALAIHGHATGRPAGFICPLTVRLLINSHVVATCKAVGGSACLVAWPAGWSSGAQPWLAPPVSPAPIVPCRLRT